MIEAVRPFRNPAGENPVGLLEEFVGFFGSKGWLNRTLRIGHRERRYRICCSESEFFVFRINDHFGVPPGFSGWPVCMVTRDQIVEDSDMSPFPSGEPGARDWLHSLAGGDFRLL